MAGRRFGGAGGGVGDHLGFGGGGVNKTRFLPLATVRNSSSLEVPLGSLWSGLFLCSQ